MAATGNMISEEVGNVGHRPLVRMDTLRAWGRTGLDTNCCSSGVAIRLGVPPPPVAVADDVDEEDCGVVTASFFR